MKSRENFNRLFRYIKNYLRKNSKTGPFLKEGKLINGSEYDILNVQYGSVCASLFLAIILGILKNYLPKSAICVRQKSFMSVQTTD